MAHIYKVILRRENHEFIFCQNKSNSRFCSVVAEDRKNGRAFTRIGEFDGKKGSLKMFDSATKFKPETLEIIKQKLLNY